MRRTRLVVLVSLGISASAACSSGSRVLGSGSSGAGAGTSTTSVGSGPGGSVAVSSGGGATPVTASAGTGGQSTSSSTTGTSVTTSGTSSGTGGASPIDAGMKVDGGCVVTDPNADMDGDGWTPAEGDCNDCDPNVNPGAIDVLHQVDGGPPVWGDEDCDGTPGDVPGPCDTGLAIDDPSAMDGAKAVELCTPLTDPKKWGIKSAKWVLPDGSDPSAAVPQAFGGSTSLTIQQAYDLGHGMLSAFGTNVKVQAGQRMLGLSSGSARQPTDPGYQDVGGFDKGYTCNSPVGFPKESPACPGITTGQPHDGVALEVDLVAPTNATGFSFNFNFFTYEWPDYICSEFNDFFVALLMPFPVGQKDGNISFDSMGNPVSVNNAFLTVCGPPGNYGGKNFTCPLGDKYLVATGFGQDTAFEDHGSTYWLQTVAPVTPHQEITVRWATYDSSDGILDTTALVDNFQWIATPGAVTVGTSPLSP